MSDNAFDLRELVKAMTGAMSAELKDLWAEAKDYARLELKSFAENLRLIYKLKAQEKINLEQAKYYINIKVNSLRIVLLTIKGLSLIAAENAINAAINAVRNVVNTTIGWVLL